MLESWLTEGNLVAWLETVASIASYELTQADLDAVVFGVPDTDAERGQFFAYEFAGPPHVQFELGQDLGTSVIRVRVHAPDALIPRIETATDICAEYQLCR